MYENVLLVLAAGADVYIYFLWKYSLCRYGKTILRGSATDDSKFNLFKEE